MKITLKGNPKSTNHIYQYTCRGKFATMYMTAQGKQIKYDYQLQAQQQKTKLYEGELSIVAHIYFGDKRKRDIDNFNKLWMDALSGIVYVDDKQIIELHLFKHYDKESPRIELDIKQSD